MKSFWLLYNFWHHISTINSLYFLFCCLLFSPVTQVNSGMKLISELLIMNATWVVASNMKRLKPNFWLFLSTKDPARVIDNAFKMNSFHPDIALFHIFFLSNKCVEFSYYYIWKAYRDLTCITRDGLSLIMTRLIGIVTEKLNKLLDAVRTQVKDFNYTSHVYVNLTIAELSWLNGLHEFQEYPLFSWRGLHFEIIRFMGDAVAQFLVYLTSDLKYHVADLVKVLLYWTRNFPLTVLLSTQGLQMGTSRLTGN